MQSSFTVKMVTIKQNKSSFPSVGNPSDRLVLAFSLDPKKASQLGLPLQNEGRTCFFDVEVTPEQFTCLYERMGHLYEKVKERGDGF